MIYELSLAQLSSSFLGNTFVRYAITIGLFVFFLGFGTLMKSRNTHPSRLLLKIECFLTLIGLTTPLIFFHFYHWLGPDTILFQILNIALIALIGFLSGFELPLLAEIEKEKSSQYVEKVLSLDYLGMFLASILFPTVLLPIFGVHGAFFISGLGNSAAMTILAFSARSKFHWKIQGLALILLCLVFLYGDQAIEKYLQKIYLQNRPSNVSAN